MSGRTTAVLLALLTVAALLVRQPLIALLSGSLLAAAGAAQLWRNAALQRLTVSRQLSSDRAFVGDSLDLRITISNRKPLPLSRLAVEDRVPAGLRISGGPGLKAGVRGETLLQRSTAVAWYEAVEWQYRITAQRRGAYRFGPMTLESGDPFGLTTIREERSSDYELFVFPERLHVPISLLPPRNPLGEAVGGLLRDPLRIIGVRDYGPGDPLKDVHWPATARVGRLQTRVYETTTQRSLLIALDLDSFAFYYEGIDRDLVEHTISAAAGLAGQAIAAGYAVGLAVNGSAVNAEQLARLPAGRGNDQLLRIMRILAALQATSILPIARLLPRLAADLRDGTQLMLVSPVNAPTNQQALMTLAGQGHSVSWLYTGSGAAPRMTVVPVHQLAQIPPGGNPDYRQAAD
jgi:uncharacterized protein (DUF58 family)